ncbi:hypothetical protein DFH29DRAFT_879982 [Suillus ampliporus]|nr:hypothetical protein DFH29DRAFT_879982 [Suillus ampliporus]
MDGWGVQWRGTDRERIKDGSEMNRDTGLEKDHRTNPGVRQRVYYYVDIFLTVFMLFSFGCRRRVDEMICDRWVWTGGGWIDAWMCRKHEKRGKRGKHNNAEGAEHADVLKGAGRVMDDDGWVTVQKGTKRGKRGSADMRICGRAEGYSCHGCYMGARRVMDDNGRVTVQKGVK